MLLPSLLANGYENLTHVEWSAASQYLQSKLGGKASGIKWFIGDLFDWRPGEAIDL